MARDFDKLGRDDTPTPAELGDIDRCPRRHPSHGQCTRGRWDYPHTRHAFRVEEFRPDEDDRTPEQAAADEDTPATEVDAPTSMNVLGPAYPLTLAERGEQDRCNVEHELYGQCIEYHAHFDPQHTYRLPEGVAAAKIGSVDYGTLPTGKFTPVAGKITPAAFESLVAEMEQDTPESPEPDVRTTYVPASDPGKTAAEMGRAQRCIVASHKYGRCILHDGHTRGRVDEYGHTYRVGPGQSQQAKPVQYEVDNVTITRADGEVVAEFKANPEASPVEPEHKTSFFDSTGTPFASLTPVVTSITGEGISVGGLMPDKASTAALKRSLALVEAWLDDDEQLPLPHTGFGADLYHALRDIVRAAQS